MNLHRHSIARAELIKRPDLALRLSVAHMICGARNWKIDGKSPRLTVKAPEAVSPKPKPV